MPECERFTGGSQGSSLGWARALEGVIDAINRAPEARQEMYNNLRGLSADLLALEKCSSRRMNPPARSNERKLGIEVRVM